MNELYGVITLWILAITALSVLAAPFRRRTSTAHIFGIDDALFWGTVGGGVISWLKGKKQNDAEVAARKMYNQWITDRNQGVQDIISNLAARGIDIFGPQTTTATGTETGTTSSTTRQQQETRPTITPEYAELERMFRNILTGRLATPTSLPTGYAQGAVRGINQALAPRSQAITNLAASRGVPESVLRIGSPVETERAGRVADLTASLPLLERQLRNEDLGLASGAIGQFGRGSRSEGTSTTRGTTSSEFSRSATAPPNISALANLLLPPSPNAPLQTGYSPALDVGGDLLTALLGLYLGRNKGSRAAGTAGGAGGGIFDDAGNYVGE